ncbi:hypothetical protein JCM21142_3925 [Saccharicrinis fermentans DSM 9555 = JCM 21142]|uniref:Uncharacterized protein n=2 Tax=Saccharicrinis fermentans TaxID=982 RepID=W7XVR6_9BACT|nr:hypothetical protein JCM21142_3925 [Saccharicrinis fermentans DSM 9555 = JCM 21142]
MENDTTIVNDIILPLKGNRDTLRKPAALKSLSFTDRYEIDQLNEIPIYLKVMGNSTNKQFITASTRGAELTMDTYRGNISQQYYIKILPASTGIPYLIYSKITNTPLSVGSYQSNPDVKVLYARSDASGSLFGSSWDFNKGEYTNNSFVIENQDFPESGGGSWWDIYYNVITVDNSKILFSKYNNSPRQEFEIIPVETFVVEEIQFDVDAGSILSNVPLQVYKEGYTNNGPIEQTYTFAVNKSYTQSSDFKRSTSYKVSLSTTVETGVPFIAKGEISASTEFGQEFTYGESESTTIAVNRSYPVKVPANYRADLSLTFIKYNMDVDYIATCRGLTSGKIIEIKGVWSGVDVEETDANLTLTPLDGGTIQKMKISQEMLDSKKVIELK